MGLAFFGLTTETAPQIRLSIFKQIHEIVFHGKGGYDYITVYNLPIWLRKFTFSEIKTFYDEEQKEYNKQSSGKNKGNQTLVDSDGKINTPEFTKASQQYKQAEKNLNKFKGKTGYKK